MPIHTDREIRANKPDIIIRDHTNQRCWIIDMAVPSDRNASSKVVEEFSKYKDLQIEIKKGLEKYVDKILGTARIYKSRSSKKITLLGTAHILRKVLSIK